MTLRHWNISAQGYFGTWTFWHITFWHHAKQYRHFSTDILAWVPPCQNVHVPKCPSATSPPCQNVHDAKKYPCWNVLVSKCPRAEKSPWWNVRVEMSHVEMSGAEISKSLINLVHFWTFKPETNKGLFVSLVYWSSSRRYIRNAR